MRLLVPLLDAAREVEEGLEVGGFGRPQHLHHLSHSLALQLLVNPRQVHLDCAVCRPPVSPRPVRREWRARVKASEADRARRPESNLGERSLLLGVAAVRLSIDHLTASLRDVAGQEAGELTRSGR